MSPPQADKKKKRWLTIVAGLFLLICLGLAASGLLLKRGVESSGFRLGPAAVSGVHLQWRDKLVLQVDELRVDLDQDRSESVELLKSADRLPLIVRSLETLFQEITVQSVKVKELSGTLDYGGDGFFVELAGEDFTFRSRLRVAAEYLHLDIEEVASSTYRSKGSGRIRLHLRTMRASGSLELTLAESLPLSLEFESDREQVTLTGREAGTISTITPFVDLFG
ncbi:MAG: hypothetical protein ABFR63_07365, partial [Thermodesulfobacteriota bacterium]